MKSLTRIGSLLAVSVLIFAGCSTTPKNDGSVALFDGKTLNGWHNYKPGAPVGPGWVAENGILKKIGGVEGGDIITEKTYNNFDLTWEWRISPAGNNGIKYFILAERKAPIGHEYQMLDDTANPDAKIGKQRQTASFYDVLPPADDKPLKPVGEWNYSRVLVEGNHVVHWLNGKKVLEYDCGSPEVMAAVAKSKFKKVAGFGTKVQGYILLTDHHDECWFRNIRIRELP